MKQLKKIQYLKYAKLGDILFTMRTNTIVSNVIAKVTDSEVSHVAIIINKKECVEARGDGRYKSVIKNGLLNIFTEDGIKCYVGIPKISPIISDEDYLYWLNKQVGKKYDYFNTLIIQPLRLLFGKVLVGQKQSKADNAWMCSELAGAGIYKYFGIFKNWSRIENTPQSIFELTDYFDYYELID